MATIHGSGISGVSAFLYSAVLSRLTGPRLSPWRTRLVRKHFRAFGAKSTVSFGTRILEPSKISVGSRSSIPNMSVIDGRGGLTIGNDCLLGFENVILSSTHASERIDRPIAAQGMFQSPVEIGDDVWTGCRVVVLPGVRIGSHAIVGAGSIVTDDIPDWAIAVGAPARVIRDRRDGGVIDAREVLEQNQTSVRVDAR
jgi:acetyltransferase-like isoleucine patch superfamily enzyme